LGGFFHGFAKALSPIEKAIFDEPAIQPLDLGFGFIGLVLAGHAAILPRSARRAETTAGGGAAIPSYNRGEPRHTGGNILPRRARRLPRYQRQRGYRRVGMIAATNQPANL
jgi:hypothetical protein